MEFIKENKRSYSVLLIILSIVSLGLVFMFGYDIFMCRQDFKNRKKLLKLLKNKKVSIHKEKSSYIMSDNIVMYTLTIEGEAYSLWIWNNTHITLDSKEGDTLIGLFKGSLIAKFTVKSIIKRITENE